MEYFDRIYNDLKCAMKSKDKIKVNTLRMLIAQLKNEKIKLNKDLTLEQELSVLLNAAKKVKDSIDIYEKSNRLDLLEKEKAELEIISAYLPEQMSKEAISDVIDDIIQGFGVTGLKEMGKVMSEAMKQLKGKADGKIVQEIVKDKLNQLK